MGDSNGLGIKSGCHLWVLQGPMNLICIDELKVIAVPLDSNTEVNRLQAKFCCSRMHGGLRNIHIYVGISCWWVDCKL